VLRKGVDPLDLYLSICALGFFVFSNRYTLGVIFNTDVTGATACAAVSARCRYDQGLSQA